MGFLRAIFRRDTINVATLVLGSGTFVALYGKNSFFGEYYTKKLQKYDIDKKPIPVDPILKFRFESVLNDFGFTEWKRNYIRLFINDKLEPQRVGSTETHHGVWLGVPEYYQRASEETIINTAILIDKKPVNWDSADGDKFLNSLKLTENAQKFIFAYHLAISDGFYTTFDACLPPIILVGFHSVGSVVYDKLRLHHRPFTLTAVMYTFLGLATACLYVFLNDGLYFMYSKAAEEKVSEMGMKYIHGGIEYYTKLIERNKALRSLMKNGAKSYTAAGNEYSIWRAHGMPYTIRLNLMGERVGMLLEKEEARRVPPVNPNPHPIL